MADEPINLVLETLRRIETKVDRMDTRLGRIEAVQKTQSSTLNILRQDSRMLRTAVNDLARENVTPGEMAVAHDDLNRLQSDVDELTTRVEMIEARSKDH
jgi:ubiquinone biosynthesis protein UbiJ